MRPRFCLLFVILTSITLAAFAQTDKWTGTWQVSHKSYATASPITMQLQIGVPEQGVLYPAKIKLQYGNFTGVYELLLARKNEQQLGISKGKYPLQQTPFKLGVWLWYLNGTLDFKDNKISVNRMWINQFGIWMAGLYADDEIWVQTKVMLRDFLYRDPITMKKVNDKPLADSSVRRILHSDLYFGKYDQIIANDSAVLMQVEDQEQYDEDTVTLVQNTRPIFSKEQINDKNRRQNIALDTGRNLFVFFADNYGGLPPNTGNLYMKIDGKEYSFDFRDQPNPYATFVVADLYHPVQPVKNTLTTIAEQRTTTPVATFKVDTPNIVLELWDERVEDGDSISLSLNGKWIATGFPVRNNVQKIPVKLQKGENVLLFMADNLGRIPPNTSVLRIRFGRNSKRLGINTDMHKNSEIRIMVE